jgi:hypothetical protein
MQGISGQRPYAEVPVADIARAAGVSPLLIVFPFGMTGPPRS